MPGATKNKLLELQRRSPEWTGPQVRCASQVCEITTGDHSQLLGMFTKHQVKGVCLYAKLAKLWNQWNVVQWWCQRCSMSSCRMSAFAAPYRVPHTPPSSESKLTAATCCTADLRKKVTPHLHRRLRVAQSSFDGLNCLHGRTALLRHAGNSPLEQGRLGWAAVLVIAPTGQGVDGSHC